MRDNTLYWSELQPRDLAISIHSGNAILILDVLDGQPLFNSEMARVSPIPRTVLRTLVAFSTGEVHRIDEHVCAKDRVYVEWTIIRSGVVIREGVKAC